MDLAPALAGLCSQGLSTSNGKTGQPVAPLGQSASTPFLLQLSAARTRGNGSGGVPPAAPFTLLESLLDSNWDGMLPGGNVELAAANEALLFSKASQTFLGAGSSSESTARLTKAASIVAQLVSREM